MAEVYGLPQRNEQLARVMTEAQLSNKALARAVREVSARHGQPISCDHTSVSRWLGGMRPRGHAPMFIAEALSARLSRTITLAEIGFPAADCLPEDLGTTYEESLDRTTATLAQLWRADLDDIQQVVNAPTHGAIGTEAALAWLIRGEAESPIVRSAGQRIGQADIDTLRATVHAFSSLDNRYGGGQARRSLVQYLGTDAAMLLNGRYSEETGRELHSAIAEATLLAAWMAYDSGVHGIAQRYFVQALRLAQAANDVLLAGSILDAMSHQSTFLRRPREAANLARAARSGTRGKATATLTAHFYAMEARALACGGEARASQLALAEAARLFERRQPNDDPAWISYFDEAELNAEFSHCLRDIGRHSEAATYAGQSLTNAGASARSDFFVSMVLATGRAGQEDLEEACHAAREALTAGLTLKSARCLDYVRQFRLAIDPFAKSTVVRDFLESVAENELWQASGTNRR